MKRALLVLFVIYLSGLSVIGQESGNQGVYGRRTQRPNPSSGTIYGTEEKDLVPVQLVEAYVLFNAAPDEFVAVFGVAQEAPTAVESNQKVNSQIEQFLEGAGRLGVKRGDTYVDMITQNRIYNFGPVGNDNTIREKLSGFETKKTIAIRYKDRQLLEKLLAAAAQARFSVAVGHFHLRPVGPHPRGSCQLTVATDQFGDLAQWLALNRGPLTIFAHANTADDLADHTKHVIWFGESEDLDLSIFS